MMRETAQTRTSSTIKGLALAKKKTPPSSSLRPTHHIQNRWLTFLFGEMKKVQLYTMAQWKRMKETTDCPGRLIRLD